MMPEELCKPLEPDDYWLDYIKNNFYYSKGHVYRKNNHKPIGSPNDRGYLVTRLGPTKSRNEKRNFKVHHIAWFLFYGIWPSGELDHEDRNRKNNLIENLKVVGRTDNLSKRIFSNKTQDPF